MRKSRRSFGQIRTRQNSTNFYVRFPWGAGHVERVAGPSRTIADRKLAHVQVLLAENATLGRILEEVFGEAPAAKPCPTLREAIKPYLSAMKVHLKESTLEGYENVLNAFAALPWADERLDRIEHGVLRLWRAGRVHQVSASTINRSLSALSSLFTWAIEEDIITVNPVRRLKKLPEDDRARETYLTELEARALVDAAAPHFKPFLIGALATGMRRSELMKMTWASVVFDQNRGALTVEAKNAKSRERRTVRMSAWLRETLLPLAPGAGAQRAKLHPFGWPDGRAFTPWEVRKFFQQALTTCTAIPDEKKATIVLHSLRHTAASLMVAAGVPIFDVSQILGHKILQVTMRYAHFAPEAGRAAIDALDRRLRATAPAGDGVAEGSASLDANSDPSVTAGPVVTSPGARGASNSSRRTCRPGRYTGRGMAPLAEPLG